MSAVDSEKQRSDLGPLPTLSAYQRRDKYRRVAQLVAPDGDSIRTCGERVPVPRRWRTDRDSWFGHDAGRILSSQYREHHCKRRWTCAVCAYIDGRRIRDTLSSYFGAWVSRGGGLGLLTLAPAHPAGVELMQLWAQLRAGRQAAMRGTWTRDMHTYGIAGYAWVIEVLETAGRWNPHCHVALLLDRPLGFDDSAELRTRTADRFAGAVRKASGEAVSHAQDLKLWEGSAERLAGYLTKSHTRILPLSQRQGENRTHLEILADFADTGEGYDRWQEFTAASVNQPRMGRSKGIADVLAQRHLLG